MSKITSSIVWHEVQLHHSITNFKIKKKGFRELLLSGKISSTIYECKNCRKYGSCVLIRHLSAKYGLILLVLYANRVWIDNLAEYRPFLAATPLTLGGLSQSTHMWDYICLKLCQYLSDTQLTLCSFGQFLLLSSSFSTQILIKLYFHFF